MDSISEIIENPNKLSKPFNSEESNSISGSSNINSIKCTKNLFSKEGLKNNISSYILIIFIFHFLLSIILFIKCGYHLLNNEINNIINEKQKMQKQNKNNNQLVTERKKGIMKKSKKNIGKRKAISNYPHYPPKKKSGFLNNKDLSKTVNTKNSNSKIHLGFSNLSTYRNKILSKKKKNKTLNNNPLNKNERNITQLQKSNQNLKISYNDFELNSLDYKKAILYDKRKFYQYYLYLIKFKNLILFSFCPINDYNIMIIKTCIFSLSFSIFYAINFAFFDDNTMHKIYELGGKYDIIYFIPTISISFFISYYIMTFIKFIFLSERNIIQVRMQQNLSMACSISDKVKKNLTIKYIIFFVLGVIFLVFFWMLLSSFGAVYPNTQMFIFKNTLISLAMSLLYPFFINIFPCIFRMSSLNSNQKDSEFIYKLSKVLQFL